MSAARMEPRTRAGKPRLPTDPATRYASKVAAGKIVAGRAVRLACARHLADLRRQRSRGFPYYYDAAAARHVIAFFPEFLTLEDGAVFVLPEWLQFCYGCIFGWKRVADQERKYQYGFFETSKGSGKTPSAGGIGLYVMVMEDVQFAEIYSAAFDKGQASLILNDAIRMAKASEDLSRALEIGKYNIANRSSGSFFRAVSSEHRGKSGPRPYLVLGDEVHEQRDGRVINKLTAGFKHHTQPMALLYTNSGSDKTSICWEYHQKSIAVLEGTHVDEQWFAYVCHLDPCPECFDKGYRQPTDGCRHCDDWTNPAVWPKVAPALGVVIRPKYLQDAVDMARSVPSEYSLKRRLNFCIWTESHQVWIQPDQWQACQVPAVATASGGRSCAVGFDMSEKLDLTACAIGVRVDDEDGADGDVVELIENDNGQEVKKTLNINFCVDLTTHFWLPRTTLLERVRTERIPFDRWEADGHLHVTDGPVIDYDAIYDQFRLTIAPPFRPDRVGYDKHNASQFALQLRDKAKFTVVDVQQGRALSESFKLFEALVRLRRIRHNGNPVMGWCVSNAEPKRDRYENLWLEKPSPTKRIDGVIAAVIMLSQLVLLPPRRKKKAGGARMWTPSGFRTLTEAMTGEPDAAHI